MIKKSYLVSFLILSSTIGYGQSKNKKPEPVKPDSAKILTIQIDSTHMVWMHESLSLGINAWDKRQDLTAAQASERKEYIALVIQFIGQNYNTLFPLKEKPKK